jgi:hypothetical protein
MSHLRVILVDMTLVDMLRAAGAERPAFDRGAAGRMRVQLEAAAGGAPEGATLTVTKARLHQVLLCPAHLIAALTAPDLPTPEKVAGKLLDRLFGLVATGSPLGADPVGEALGAARAADELGLIGDWESLPGEEQDEVRAIVAACLPAVVAWPALPGSALVRVQEPMRIELAGGRVVLSARADVVIGQPGAQRVGTRLIDVKSGRHRHQDRVDAGWYAVLETLRHRAPPFQAGMYYLREGALVLELVTAGLLEQASERIAEGIRRMVALAGGAEAETNPSPLCPWCPAIDSCEPGQRLASERGAYIPRVTREDEDEL